MESITPNEALAKTVLAEKDVLTEIINKASSNTKVEHIIRILELKEKYTELQVRLLLDDLK